MAYDVSVSMFVNIIMLPVELLYLPSLVTCLHNPMPNVFLSNDTYESGHHHHSPFGLLSGAPFPAFRVAINVQGRETFRYIRSKEGEKISARQVVVVEIVV